MRNILSPESPAMRFLTLFCDWMYVNILFLISSIPIFTIGASLTAMYSVWFKRIRGDDVHIGKTFWKEFKANFKQSTFFWIPYLIIMVFLIADVFLIRDTLDPSLQFLQYPVSIIAFLVFCATIFVFPQMAVFDSKTMQIIKNSVLLGISNFPTVILCIVFHLFPLLIAGLSPKWTVIIFSLVIFFGIGCIEYFCCFFYRRVFIKCLGDDEDDDEDIEEEIEE